MSSRPGATISYEVLTGLGSRLPRLYRHTNEPLIIALHFLSHNKSACAVRSAISNARNHRSEHSRDNWNSN